MRTDFAAGSSRPIAVQFPIEFKPWAQRHVALIGRRGFILFLISDSFRDMDAATPCKPHIFDPQKLIFLSSANASRPKHTFIPLVFSDKTKLPDQVCSGRLNAWLPDYMLKAMYRTT